MSCKYFPIKPLLFPRPFGCALLFEFNRILALLHDDAPSITNLDSNLYSLPFFLFMYDIPVALPFLSVVISLTIESV